MSDDDCSYMSKLIKRCSEEVYDELEYGLSEESYVKALMIELRERDLKCESDVYVNQYYKGDFLTALKIDLIVYYQDEPFIIAVNKEYHQVERCGRLMDVKNYYLINFGVDAVNIISSNDE